MKNEAYALVSTSVSAMDLVSVTVDEFGALHQKIAEDIKRYERLKKTLAGFAKEAQGPESVELVGQLYRIQYSAPSKQYECTLEPEEFIEWTACWSALTVSVAQARQHLAMSQFLNLFKAKEGTRKLVSVEETSWKD